MLILQSLSYACFYASGMHFREPQQLMPQGHNTRIFICFLWIYVIIVTTAYSSNLTAFLTVTHRPQGINTIKSLHATHMEVSGLGNFFKGALASAVDPYLQVNYAWLHFLTLHSEYCFLFYTNLYFLYLFPENRVFMFINIKGLYFHSHKCDFFDAHAYEN